MKFTNWLRGLFFNEDKTINIKEYREALQQIAIEDFAISSAINLIAGIISKCEFKTFMNGLASKKDEYYLLNIEPNVNQNSTQFWQEALSKLLYYNEVLIIENNAQLMIADDFTQKEFALRENIFTGVSRGDFTFDRPFFMSEVIYLKLNREDIRQKLSILCQSYTDLINRSIKKYNKSGGRKGILNISAVARGKPNFETTFEELMNKRFKTYFDAENAVLPLFDGFDFTEQTGEQSKKSANEIGDIKTLTAEAFDRVAQAYKIPPALLKGDIADIEKLTDNFLTFCIDPLCDLIQEEFNRKRYGRAEYIKGNYVDIDTTCIKHIDIFSIAANVDKLIACGAYSINEVREKANDSLLNDNFANTHFITKNYTNVNDLNTAEGGEKT